MAPDLKLPTPRELMHLTLANKQICGEALPYFYQLNTFFFYGPGGGASVLSALAASRRDLLASLAVVYDPLTRFYSDEQSKLDARFFRMLVGLKGLKKVCIEVNEKGWFDVWRNRRGGQKFNAGNIPGFDHLLKIADTVDVQLVGDCPTIAANWKKATQEAVDAAKAKRRGRKRKQINIDDEQPKKKTPKARKSNATQI